MPERKPLPKWIYYVLLCLLVSVFLVSSWYVAGYLKESYADNSRYEDLASIVAGMSGSTTGADDAPDTDTLGEKVMLPGYGRIYEMNPDTVGWIKIEGTDVDYPVMQTPDRKDYYLKRNFDQKYSDHGCIYINEQCDVFKPSDNLTLYGHHMKDGSMFFDLDKYMKQEFWETYPDIRFDTLYEQHTYRIFAVFKTTASVGEGFPYHNFIDARDENDFDWFISQCKNLSFYETGITPAYGDKIICLSTCEYTLINGRLVVAAVQIK